MSWQRGFRVAGYIDLVLHTISAIVTLIAIPIWFAFILDREEKKAYQPYLKTYWIFVGIVNLFNVIFIVAAWRLIQTTRQNFDLRNVLERYKLWMSLKLGVVCFSVILFNILGLLISLILISVASSTVGQLKAELAHSKNVREIPNI